jgi:AraC-like DNA-binding protein
MTFAMGKGSAWQFTTDGNKMEIFILAITPGAGKLFQKYLETNAFAINLRSPLDIQRIFEQIFHEAKHSSFHSHEICLHHLHALLMKIAQNKVSKTKRGRQSLLTFNKCRQYIDRHFEKIRFPREVSEQCNVAHEYMCRLFKQYEKRSPQQYLVSLKLNRAIYLLTTTQLSVKEISEELNFDSPYTFSRTFKKQTGTSPTERRLSS